MTPIKFTQKPKVFGFATQNADNIDYMKFENKGFWRSEFHKGVFFGMALSVVILVVGFILLKLIEVLIQ